MNKRSPQKINRGRGRKWSRALKMPWAIRTEIRRWLAHPFILIKFKLKGLRWGKGCRIYGAPIIQHFRGSRITLGSHVVLRSWVNSNPIAPDHPVVLATRAGTAEIKIGDECGLTGVTIVAEEKVQIGQRVFVGANSTIVDTDFHPLRYDDRFQQPRKGGAEPTVIENDVFIGMNVMILKGVRIGEGSIIGAGSVVTKDVPPHHLAVGNPAINIGHIHG